MSYWVFNESQLNEAIKNYLTGTENVVVDDITIDGHASMIRLFLNSKEAKKAGLIKGDSTSENLQKTR